MRYPNLSFIEKTIEDKILDGHIDDIHEFFRHTPKPKVRELFRFMTDECGDPMAELLDDATAHIINLYAETQITDISIPEGVTVLGPSVFKNCLSLSRVKLPRSLKTMGIEVFYGTSALNEIEIPEGITHIPSESFKGSGISKIALPSTVTTISIEAFASCSNLEEINLPDGLQIIEDNAFDNSKVTNLELPQSLIYLGHQKDIEEFTVRGLNAEQAKEWAEDHLPFASEADKKYFFKRLKG